MSRNYLNNPNDFPKVGVIAYENSGENLLRVYLERIFSIFSDTNIKAYRSKLFNHRENLDLSYIVYTDFPIRGKGEYRECSIAQGIVLIRNPIEVIMSKILKEKAYKGNLSIVDDLIDQWIHFHQYWIESPIPIRLIRYEDLLHNPLEVLKDLTCFLLGVTSIESSKVEYLIKLSVIEDIKQDFYAYDLEVKNDSDKVYLTREKLTTIQSKMEKLIDWLGKFNYEGKGSSWLKDFNDQTQVDSIQMHSRISDSYVLSYKALDIYKENS